MKRKLASVGVVVAVAFMGAAIGCSSSSSDDNAGVTNDGGTGDSMTVQPGADSGGDAFTTPFPDAALTPVSFTAIGDAATDLVAPGRGAEFWNGSDPAIDVPTAGSPAQSLNFYYRFQWDDFEDATKGVYSWTKFDNVIHQAIDAGQSFSFGIMPMCQGCGSATVAGSIMDYPMYLHTEMQAEGIKDWNDTADQIWVPNWNSNSYLSGWENLLTAVASHIATTSYKSIAYASTIYFIDVRGYGNFGEWHTYPWYQNAAAPVATDTSLIRIIDSHITAFPNYPLVTMIAAFDSGNASSMPADVTNHALTAKNTWGPLGWRRDNWGDPGYAPILDQNPGSFGSVMFKTLITTRWQTSPIVGEPLADSNSVSNSGANCDYYQFVDEVQLYHATSFGNGNIANPSVACAQDNVRAASRASGYRIVLDGGGVTSKIGSDRTLGVKLSWKNVGLAPTYQPWNVTFELRDSKNAVAWSSPSSMKLQFFQPLASDTTSADAFVLPATVASGSYTLHLIMRDPKGYMKPFPLAVEGVETDGAYALGTVTIP